MTDRPTTRRRLLLGGGAALLAGLAGCTAGGTEDEATTTETDRTTEASSTTQPTTDESTTAAPETPHDLDSVHMHGTMRLVIDGTVYHFGDRPHNMEERTGDPHFHFHTDGKRDLWHVHSKGVTLGYGVDAMPKFDLTATKVEFRGHTYNDAWPGTSVEVTVNGAPLSDPRAYRLRDGDAVLVTVETDRPTPTPTPTATPTDGTGNGTA